VASKHFGHVTFYAAQQTKKVVQYVNKARKKILPFVLNPPELGHFDDTGGCYSVSRTKFSRTKRLIYCMYNLFVKQHTYT